MKKLALAALLMVSGSAFADTCEGLINEYLVYGTGVVTIKPDWRNNYIQICNINEIYKNISPNTCKGMLSTIMTAKAQNQKLSINYSGSVNCSTMPLYSGAPAPAYLLVGR